jgi:hypothetical protein
VISEDCGIEMGTKGVIRKRKCNQRNKNDLLKSYFMIFPLLTVIIVSGMASAMETTMNLIMIFSY